jgi:hypothetical protein
MSPAAANLGMTPGGVTLLAGACSSAEEHRTSNPTVGGSNPPRRMEDRAIPGHRHDGCKHPCKQSGWNDDDGRRRKPSIHVHWSGARGVGIENESVAIVCIGRSAALTCPLAIRVVRGAYAIASAMATRVSGAGRLLDAFSCTSP